MRVKGNKAFSFWYIGFAILCGVLLFTSTNTLACSNCSMPPFWATPVSPNVLMVLDVSGSMQCSAYLPYYFGGYNYNSSAFCTPSDSDSNHHPDAAYSYQTSYYGYFETDAFYRYDSAAFGGSGGFVKVDNLSECESISGHKVCSEDRSVACTSDTDCADKGKCIDGIGGPNCISGNFLNWATMSRVDLLRKVLVGGRKIDEENNYSIIRSEGGRWEYKDFNTGCYIKVQYGSYPTLEHTLTITNTDEDLGTCGYLTIKAKDGPIWSTSDDCFFVYQRLTGDFDVRIKVVSVPEGGSYSKITVMARASLNSSSRRIFVSATNPSDSNVIQFAYRPSDGGDTSYVNGSDYGLIEGYSLPIWLRLVRTSQTFKAYYSEDDGNTWHELGGGGYTYSGENAMPDTIYVGIAAASYSSSYEKAEVDEFVCHTCSGGRSDDFNDGYFDTATWSVAEIGNGEGTTIERCGGCVVGGITDAKIRVAVASDKRKGVLQRVLDKNSDGVVDRNAPRIGIEVFSSSSRNGCIRTGVTDANIDEIISVVESEAPYGGTPTIYAIQEAYDYFKQHNDHTGNCNNDDFIGGQGSSKDPWYDYDEDNNEYVPVPCRKSYIITISDGEWNTGGDPIEITHNSHVYDLRTDMSEDQVLDHYTVFIFSDEPGGIKSMKNMAMYGGFTDKDGNKWPYNVSSYPYTSKTTDLPSVCNPANGVPPELCKEWDKNGDGLPDHFFEANKGEELERALVQIFEEIQDRGSASSVASTTQQFVGRDIVIRGAFKHNPNNDIIWEGSFGVFWPNDCGVYEFQDCADIAYSNRCNCEPSCTWKSCGEIYSQSECNETTGCSWDTTFAQCLGGGGKCEGHRITEENLMCRDLSDADKKCWDAGEMLSSTSRNIFVGLDLNSDSKIDKGDRFSVDFADQLESYLKVSRDITGDGNISIEDTKALIKWIVGEETNYPGTRDRNEWLLGDIIYSTPVVVGPPAISDVPPKASGCVCGYVNESLCGYTEECLWENGSCIMPSINYCSNGCECDLNSQCKDLCYWCFRQCNLHRKKVAYVGANDGMLHAFVVGKWHEGDNPDTENIIENGYWVYDPDKDSEIGKELWAYIPSNLLSELECISSVDYGLEGSTCPHKAMVDLSPTVWNVFIDPDSGGANSQGKRWRTVLIGGERGGGDVYFAIDVTDPDNPRVLWEYSVIRNLSVHESENNYTFPFSRDDYLKLKNLPLAYSVPTVAKLLLPGMQSSYNVYNTISPMSEKPYPDTLSSLDTIPVRWFAFFGGGIRAYDPSSWGIDWNNNERWKYLFYPYLAAIDLESGKNLFQLLWAHLFEIAGSSIPSNSSTYIPSAINSPLVLDVLSEDGKIVVSRSSSGADGFVDLIYAGDLNGNFYSIKFFNPGRPEFGNNVLFCANIVKTRKISDSYLDDNIFRSSHQPITKNFTAAFDRDSNLRVYFGTGKFEDVEGDSSDKHDRAPMSFYCYVEDIRSSKNLCEETEDFATIDGFVVKRRLLNCDTDTSSHKWIKSDGKPDGNDCFSCIFDLPHEGERIVSKPLVAGGMVFFTTFVPDTDPCSSGGEGYLYILDYMCRPFLGNPLRNLQAGFEYQWFDRQANQWKTGAPPFGGSDQTSNPLVAAFRVNLGKGMPSSPKLVGNKVMTQTSQAKIIEVNVEGLKGVEIVGWKRVYNPIAACIETQ